jgi:3-oxoacyl-[acyl-carrier protein] reductase
LYFDVTDATGIKSAVLRIKKEQGRLDCLVNNAGIMKDALIGMIDGKVMRRTFEVNVYAVIELTQLAARIMKSGASVINIASIAGTNGNKGQVVYAASKGAVIALTKSAAKELAPGNIRVNAIAPGSIDTDLFRAIGADKIPAFESSIGMGRLGKPEDVAKVALFLASDLSEYVTGQIIGADGAAIM